MFSLQTSLHARRMYVTPSWSLKQLGMRRKLRSVMQSAMQQRLSSLHFRMAAKLVMTAAPSLSLNLGELPTTVSHKTSLAR